MFQKRETCPATNRTSLSSWVGLARSKGVGEAYSRPYWAKPLTKWRFAPGGTEGKKRKENEENGSTPALKALERVCHTGCATGWRGLHKFFSGLCLCQFFFPECSFARLCSFSLTLLGFCSNATLLRKTFPGCLWPLILLNFPPIDVSLPGALCSYLLIVYASPH